MRRMPDRLAKFADKGAGVHARLPRQRVVIHVRGIFPQTQQGLRHALVRLAPIPVVGGHRRQRRIDHGLRKKRSQQRILLRLLLDRLDQTPDHRLFRIRRRMLENPPGSHGTIKAEREMHVQMPERSFAMAGEDGVRWNQ